MKVRELVELLSRQDPDAEVVYYYDSAPRGDIEFGWKARSGEVILSGSSEYIHDDFRPPGAPTISQDLTWPRVVKPD